MDSHRKKARVTNKEEGALRIIYKNVESLRFRAKTLEDVNEYGFAILIHWNLIESSVKILKTFHRPSNGYPDKLNFINRSWKLLKVLYENNEEAYKLIFGDGGKTANSLHSVRDRIAHASYNLDNNEYIKYKNAAFVIFQALFSNLPLNYDLARRELVKCKQKCIVN